MSHSPTMAWSAAAMLPSFIKLKQQQQALQEKRTIKGDLQYIQWNRGNSVPKRTNVGPNKRMKQ
jgi:hypothetical protein